MEMSVSSSRSGIKINTQEKAPSLKSIKEYKSKVPERLSYIPVLDKNAECAADYLTINDMNSSYKLLKEVFKEIESDHGVHQILYDTIMFNQTNFNWYCKFFKQLECNLKIVNVYDLPYDKCPEAKDNKIKITRGASRFLVHSPYGIYYKKGMYSLSYLPSNKNNVDFISNYRIKYILDAYSIEDFKGCTLPGWYSLSNTTIYEKYSYKTSTRIRIDYRDGQLYYFIAGASDNWKEIEDVPEDMIYVIFSLLYKNYLVDDGEVVEDVN